jgi:hypothetical protein
MNALPESFFEQGSTADEGLGRLVSKWWCWTFEGAIAASPAISVNKWILRSVSSGPGSGADTLLFAPRTVGKMRQAETRLGKPLCD